MRSADLTRLAGGAVVAHRLRSLLTALGIAVGVAAVVLLTSIGAGIHEFVLNEFTQFGTNLVEVTPGRTTTHGGSVGVIGSTRPLTLDDAQALTRVRHVRAVVPVVQGNAEVEADGRRRRTTVFGVSAQFPAAFSMQPALGRFLPADDPRAPRAFVVLGQKVREELFGSRNPLGQRLRVGGMRYRVIGVMERKGQMLGFDLDDTVFIPTARAMELFDREGLMEIDVLYPEGAPVDEVVAGVTRVLEARHGRRDFTTTTQQQMLDVLSNVLSVLTFAVGALGGISLVVGGVGILTIMTIAVKERTPEIGLLRALGAEQNHVLLLFLAEAAALAAVGGLAGLLIGAGGAQLLHWILPALPVTIPWTYVIGSEAVAVMIGLGAGVMPARKAARLDPITALRTE